MSQPPFDQAFNPRRFRSTVPYYARYRLAYPESLLARVAGIVGLAPGDPVLDLGCGPGLLAVPFARAGMAVTAVDPEPDMLDETRRAADEAGVALDIRQGSSFALPSGIGPFKLVTMGRSFHWMDREPTLRALDGLVRRDGALAFFDDHHPPTAENRWRVILRETGIRFGRNESPHIAARLKPDHRTVESLLLDSAFPQIELCAAYIRREITVDEIVGLAFSLSTMSRERLGGRADAFEAELRAALAELSPAGRFTEIAQLDALIARRG
jgi:SAM-dependent methyltransferase